MTQTSKSGPNFHIRINHQPELLVKTICLFSPELELTQSFPFLALEGPGESKRIKKAKKNEILNQLHDSEGDTKLGAVLPAEVSC